MSEDTYLGNKVNVENVLKRELLKGCCKVFQWRNDREINITGCVAVTIKNQSSSGTPLLYFVHINRLLAEQDYNSCIESENQNLESRVNSNGSSEALTKNIKTESETIPSNLFNVLPAEMIPPGKGFVVKTQTVYEKTASGEERKVSISTQGLLDTSEVNAFTRHYQGTSDYKQEAEESNFQGDVYCDESYDQNNYTNIAESDMQPDEFYQAYPQDGEYFYEEDPVPPPPRKKAQQKPPLRSHKMSRLNQAKRRAAMNVKNRAANFQTVIDMHSQDSNESQIHGGYSFNSPQPRSKPARGNIGRSHDKLGHASHDPSNPYVVTRSMHECGYPGCGKRFKWKQHLLRHQTEKHGRVPSKKLAFEKVLVKNPNYQRQTNNSYCTAVPSSEYDYEDAGFEGEMAGDMYEDDGGDYYG